MQQVCVRNFYADHLFSAVAGKAIFKKNGLWSYRDKYSRNRKMHVACAVMGFHAFSSEGGILPHGF